jgi:hypothetical protein
MMVKWTVEHIFNFQKPKLWGNGFAHNGFHGKDGKQYAVLFDSKWMGCLEKGDNFLWTAGPVAIENSKRHITVNWCIPNNACLSSDGSLLVSSEGDKKIYRIIPDEDAAYEFIDAKEFGIKDLASCEYDPDGNIWVCEITGCRVWQFGANGKPIRVLGNGTPGFQHGSVSFNEARFNWIYCLKCGPDGKVYVLDSKNYAIRMIDIQRETVTTVVGTGQPGYSGDGGDPVFATLGTSKRAFNGFDGPWYMAFDDDANIYIADSMNFVVRMVDRSTNIISTIAGKRAIHRGKRIDPHETDPLNLNLPHICSLDYYKGRLFVPEWKGDLVVLSKVDGVS